MSQIYFTPTSEQLTDLALNHPELNENIKASILKEITAQGSRYIESKLKSTTTRAIDSFTKNFESTYFKTQGSYSDKLGFTPAYSARLSAIANEQLSAFYDAEFKAYLESMDFKTTLQRKMRERILAYSMAMLDEELKLEAKKLLGTV